MRVPFTQQQFLDVFGAYNSTAWPVVIALWLVTLAFGVRFVRGQARSVTLSVLAAVHWAWSGLVYHALFFTDINPAAWLLAGVFVLEAFAFVWVGIVQRTLVFEWGFTGDPRDVALREALYTALESRPLQGLAPQRPERIAS